MTNNITNYWNNIPYKERANIVFFQNLHEICKKNFIAEQIIEEYTKLLINNFNKNKLFIVRGITRLGVYVGCLALSLIKNKIDIHVCDILGILSKSASYFNIKITDVLRGIKRLIQILDKSIINEIFENKNHVRLLFKYMFDSKKVDKINNDKLNNDKLNNDKINNDKINNGVDKCKNLVSNYMKEVN